MRIRTVRNGTIKSATGGNAMIGDQVAAETLKALSQKNEHGWLLQRND